MKQKKNQSRLDLNRISGSVPMFGYQLVRDSLIPNLLGAETNAVLYWAGKELARQYPLKNFQDIVLFFEKAGFGSLTLINEKRNKNSYLLTGAAIETRLNLTDPSFNLESGFLAEQIQLLEGYYTEAFFEIQKRKLQIEMTVQWDLKDPVTADTPDEYFSIQNADETSSRRLDENEVSIEESIQFTNDSRLEADTENFPESDLPTRSSKHKKS